MDEPDKPTGISDEEWARRKAEADIATFKNVVEDATIEEVDSPTGRKMVTVAWEDEQDRFHVKEGTAIGVYREYSDAVGLNGGGSGKPMTAIESYKVEWEDGGMTTVSADDLVDLEEGEFYFEDDT